VSRLVAEAVVRTDRRRRCRELLLTVVAIGLLGMPVSYRAGAEAPHPHIVFQLWVDASRRSFDHHAHHPHDAHAASFRHADDALADPPLQAAEMGGPEGPALGAPVVPEVTFLVLVTLGWFALVFGRGRLGVSDAGLSLRGRTLLPELPPPRQRFRSTGNRPSIARGRTDAVWRVPTCNA